MPGPGPYRSQVSIPLPSEEQIRRTLGDSYDPATTLNVLKMFAGTDDMCPTTLGLVRAIFSAESVDPKLRQAIILRAAVMLNAPYELQANVPISRNNGLSDAEIDSIGCKGLPEAAKACPMVFRGVMRLSAMPLTSCARGAR